MASVDLPLHDMLGALVNATAAEVIGNVPSVPIPDDGLFNEDANHTEGQTEGFKRLHGPAFKSLCTFMKTQESNGRARCLSSLPRFSRETTATTDNVKWRAWVRNDNKDKYRLENASR